MRVEIVDGSKVFSDIYRDEQDRTWNALQRSDGSVSVYATSPYVPGLHQVAWDSLDKQPMDAQAQEVVSKALALRDELAQRLNHVYDLIAAFDGAR
jgi:hypothetical protein